MGFRYERNMQINSEPPMRETTILEPTVFREKSRYLWSAKCDQHPALDEFNNFQ
jgi:hypothetical protein